MAAGFLPDAISTDLHAGSLNGPAYDMPTVMTKFLHLGLPLPDVIARSTSRAAQAVGLPPGDIGTLAVGSEADVAVLSLEPCAEGTWLEDVAGNVRAVESRLVCRAVFRAGARQPVTEEPVWPNPEAQAWARLSADRWHIQDPQPPPDLYPELAAKIAEKQRHYAFLAVRRRASAQAAPIVMATASNSTQRMLPTPAVTAAAAPRVAWCWSHRYDRWCPSSTLCDCDRVDGAGMPRCRMLGTKALCAVSGNRVCVCVCRGRWHDTATEALQIRACGCRRPRWVTCSAGRPCPTAIPSSRQPAARRRLPVPQGPRSLQQ